MSLAMHYLLSQHSHEALQLVKLDGSPTVIFGMAALAARSEIFIRTKCVCAPTGEAVYVVDNRHS